MSDDAPEGPDPVSTAARIARREWTVLIVLSLLCVVTFTLTSSVANRVRAIGQRDGRVYYEAGREAMASGRAGDAAVAFRRAISRDREVPGYAVALADALAAAGQADEARRVLQAAHDITPGDPEVTLRRARLAAQAGDIAEAIEDYHHAVFGQWSEAPRVRARAARLELIRFLVSHDLLGQADAELLAAAADPSVPVEDRPELGRLFSRVGDARRALDQFVLALAHAPASAPLLAGAGAAAFDVGNYPVARRYLTAAVEAGETSADTTDRLDVLHRVSALDPLAGQLSAPERRRRLQLGVERVRQRLAGCRPTAGAAATISFDAIDADLNEIDRSSHHPLGADDVPTLMGLLTRASAGLDDACGPGTASDRALLLIGRLHGVADS